MDKHLSRWCKSTGEPAPEYSSQAPPALPALALAQIVIPPQCSFHPTGCLLSSQPGPHQRSRRCSLASARTSAPSSSSSCGLSSSCSPAERRRRIKSNVWPFIHIHTIFHRNIPSHKLSLPHFLFIHLNVRFSIWLFRLTILPHFSFCFYSGPLTPFITWGTTVFEVHSTTGLNCISYRKYYSVRLWKGPELWFLIHFNRKSLKCVYSRDTRHLNY